jgi:ketosteroid isomerase-like protein
MTDEAAIAELRAVEQDRIRALLAGDWAGVEMLLAEDLVHFHANGVMDSKQSYIESVSTKLDFLNIDRPSLKIRILGEVAIVTGPLNQTVRIKGPGTVVEMQGVATQTWTKQSGRWLQNTYHAGRIG